MPAAAKLTELTIQKAQPSATGQREIWDAAVPGFGLRIAAGGAKSFVFVYRTQGRSRRLTLGRWPVLGLAEARGLAREARRTVALGRDPAAEKANARHKDALLFRAVAAEFLERHAKPKNRRRPNACSIARSSRTGASARWIPLPRPTWSGSLTASSIVVPRWSPAAPWPRCASCATGRWSVGS
jgi:hypothetical protein